MKKTIMTVAILLGCMLTAFVNKAQAQIVDPMSANIPFSFYAGEKLLPAGEYTFTVRDEGVMIIQRADGKESVQILVNTNEERRTPGASEIIFNRYGNENFLSRVEEKGDPEDMVALKTKMEKRAERLEHEDAAISVPTYH